MSYNIYSYLDDGFEEDLLTNFHSKDLELYRKAIELFGDNTLYISCKAFDRNGRTLKDCYSLRTKKDKDRSDFWNLFRTLRKDFE